VYWSYIFTLLIYISVNITKLCFYYIVVLTEIYILINWWNKLHFRRCKWRYFYAVAVAHGFRTTVGAPFINTIFSEFSLLPTSDYCYSCLRVFITFPFSKTNSHNLDQTGLLLNLRASSQSAYYRTFKLAPFFRTHNLSSFMITFFISFDATA